MAKTIRVRDEIAFQTSILALNAAVETARAGGAAVGFEKAADEVRSLAPRCAGAETPVEETECPTRQGTYTAEKLNAQSAELRNMAVRLAALAGDDEAGSAPRIAGAPVRAPAKGSGF